jgi:hypothetical protein
LNLPLPDGAVGSDLDTKFHRARVPRATSKRLRNPLRVEGHEMQCH